MKSVSVRELKNNPSDALRLARESVVIVTNRDRPEAVLMHLDDEKLLREPGVRAALAVSLYKDDSLSLGRAARLADMDLADFMQHLSRLGVPVVKGDASALAEDFRDLEAWLADSA